MAPILHSSNLTAVILHNKEVTNNPDTHHRVTHQHLNNNPATLLHLHRLTLLHPNNKRILLHPNNKRTLPHLNNKPTLLHLNNKLTLLHLNNKPTLLQNNKKVLINLMLLRPILLLLLSKATPLLRATPLLLLSNQPRNMACLMV